MLSLGSRFRTICYCHAGWILEAIFTPSGTFRSGCTFFTNLTALWQKGMCDWQRDIPESGAALLTEEVHSILHSLLRTHL